MPKISLLPEETDPQPPVKIPLVSGGVTKYATLAEFIETMFENIPADNSVLTGWQSLAAPSAVSYLGNRSYQLTHAASIAATVSLGMRRRFIRSATAPVSCTDLESGSSQYYNDTTVSGMTFTDDFVVSAWIKLESHTTGTIASRWNGTSGWVMRVGALGGANGQIQLMGTNAGSGNYSTVVSAQSIPLGKWVHVAAQLDMSAFTATPTTSYIMIDGVDVPATVSRAGTNPTALVQAGNLEIGAENGGTNLFDGKIAQVAIYSAKVTQATVRASANQTLTGSETSLISAYSFNNTINDLNANANHLTAQGSAVATNADSPFAGGNVAEYTDGTTEMAVTTKISSDGLTETVQVPEGYALPTTGGVASSAYSNESVPYGFPADRGRWSVISLHIASANQGSAVDGTWYNLGSQQLSLPVGAYLVRYQTSPAITATTTSFLSQSLSTSASTESNKEFTADGGTNAGASFHMSSITRVRPVNVTAATPLYLITKQTSGTSVTIYNTANAASSIIEAEFAYV